MTNRYAHVMNLLSRHGLHDVHDESWNVYGQFTYISSWKGAFNAPYTNANGSINSLVPDSERSFTGSFTLFFGVRLWPGGDDARRFLNGLVTNDVDKVAPGKPRFAALLTPQGKIIVDFIIAEAPAGDGGGFRDQIVVTLLQSFSEGIAHGRRIGGMPQSLDLGKLLLKRLFGHGHAFWRIRALPAWELRARSSGGSGPRTSRRRPPQ